MFLISILLRTRDIWESLFLRRNIFIKRKTILLLRMDAIGDYILFRNFIKELKESTKYKDYKITLCGNIVWKDIALNLDASEINKFIWIDRYKFNIDNIQYYFKKIAIIYLGRFEVLIHPTYSRDIIAETIVKFSGAKCKIGNSGDCSNLTYESKLISDKYYDNLLLSSNEVMFEFFRNKHFFESLLNRNISITKPFINIKNNKKNLEKPPYILFAISSGYKYRAWNVINFEKLAFKIINTTKSNVYITGLCDGSETIQNIDNRIINYINQVNLNELIYLISNSVLLIGNDSAPIHIASALNIPFVCISNGNHFKRFVPYPNTVNNDCSFVFPNNDFYTKEEENNLAEMYKCRSDLDINLITVDEVYNSVIRFL